MSAIIAALEKLNASVVHLEALAAEKEVQARAPARRKRGPQEDLFAPQVVATVAARDNSMIGQRLDGAIESLERLLANG